MKTLIKKLFNWIFKAELENLKTELEKANNICRSLNEHKRIFDNVLSGIDVSVDVHEYDHKYSPSWAVISLQGQKSDYIKFINLGDRSIRDIAEFLRRYERDSNIKIDATPFASDFLRISKNKKF